MKDEGLEERYACGYKLLPLNFNSHTLRMLGRTGGLGRGRAVGNMETEDDDVNERLDTTGLLVFQ